MSLMVITQVKIIMNEYTNKFEYEVNQFLRELQQKNKVLIDITYPGYQNGTHSILIRYQEKE